MDSLSYAGHKAVALLLRSTVSLTRSCITHEDESLQIPSRDAGRTIKAHVYLPKNLVKPTPVLINWHGSGFMIPMHGTDDEYCRFISSQTSRLVIDASYRLAPEYPFPAGVQDAEDVVNWVLGQSDEYDTNDISLSGFSAGANFALGLSGSLYPKSTFKNLIAMYPPCDLSVDSGSKKAPDTTGSALPVWLTRVFDDSYMNSSIDRKQALISPALISQERFPGRILFVTAAFDSLATEAEALAERIKQVPGNHVVVRRMDKCAHGWDKSTKAGSLEEKAKNDAYQLAAELLLGS